MFIYYLKDFNSIIASGGLFDFNATLGLIGIQFLLLMLILNTILYNPILSIISDRNEYIVSNLTNAAELITTVNNIKESYEKEINEAQKSSEFEITRCRKIYQEVFNTELNNIKEEINSNIREKLILRIEKEKENALKVLGDEVDSISEKILEKCLKSK